jgi:hypothetical protein
MAMLAAVATLALPVAAAKATPPQDVNVINDFGVVSVTWALPLGMNSSMIEISSSPPNADGSFPVESLAFWDDIIPASATSYTSPKRLIAGDYYLHIVAYGACQPNQPGCLEYSDAIPLSVPQPPPSELGPLGLIQRKLVASWSLPLFLESDFLEVATSPETNTEGPDLGQFLNENTILYAPLDTAQTDFTSPAGLPGGTLYVHVAGRDPLACDPPSATSCVERFSPTKAITVPSGAPSITSAGHSGNRITASWTVPPDAVVDFIEVATSPAVDADGAFPGENTVLLDILDGVESYESDLSLQPGTYYVHVASLPSVECYYVNYSTCIDEYSDTVTVTIPADPTARQTSSTAPPRDATTALTSLSVKKRQHVDKLLVLAAMAEKGTIRVSGTVNVPNLSKVYKLKPVRATATPGKLVKLRVKLPKKALKAAKRALRRHKRVTATITIMALDSAGNVATQKRSIRLRY